MFSILHTLIAILLSFAPIPNDNDVIWNNVSVNNVSHHIAIENYDAFLLFDGGTIICDSSSCYEVTEDTIKFIEW